MASGRECWPQGRCRSEDAERAGVVLAERRERSRSGSFRSASGQWGTPSGRNSSRALHKEWRPGALRGCWIGPPWTVGEIVGVRHRSAEGRPRWLPSVARVDRRWTGSSGMLESALHPPGWRSHPNVELRRGGSWRRCRWEEGGAGSGLLRPGPPPGSGIPGRSWPRTAGGGLRRGGLLVVVDMRAHDREELPGEMGHLLDRLFPRDDGGVAGGCRFSTGSGSGIPPPDPAAKGPPPLCRGGRGSEPEPLSGKVAPVSRASKKG